MTNSNAPFENPESKAISATGLEFPDWSGMKQRHFPVSFAEAVAFNEEMNRLFPAPAEAHRLRLERKILVPFEL